MTWLLRTMSFVVNTHGYIYLLREREFVLRGEDVYKIGMTRQKMNLRIDRMNAYKKGSELILMTECPLSSCVEVESDLKRKFEHIFRRHSDGFEYFLGNPRIIAAMIFQATNEAWTDSQQSFKKELLKSTLTISEDIHATESVKQRKAHVIAPSAEDKLHNECLVYLKTLFKEAKQHKKIQAVDNVSANQSATLLLAEKTAQEEQRCKNDENNMSSWFSECVLLDATSVVKQGEWYTDYRGWADRNDMVPLIEKRAVAALKSLQPTVSVGQKTYGIKLRSANPKVPIPVLSKWLAAAFVEAKLHVKKQPTTKLLEMYKEWCNRNEFKIAGQRSNLTNFGIDIKKYGGVVQKKIHGITGYHIDWEQLQAWLIEHQHLTS